MDVIVWIAPAAGPPRGLHVAADGSFGFYGLAPGAYTFVPRDAPPGMQLESMECNRVAMTKEAPLMVGDKQDATGCKVVLVGTEIKQSN